MHKPRNLYIFTFLFATTLSLATCSTILEVDSLWGEETIEPEPTKPSTEARIEIEVWAPASRWEHWQTEGPVKAAELVEEFEIIVNAVEYASTNSFYEDQFELAAEAGIGPEIAHITSNREKLIKWINEGYIVPLDTCIQQYPEFDEVIEDLWPFVTYQGQVWAIPFEIESYVLFFNKAKLRELGWSEENIAALPEQIRKGEFTLEDMVGTINQAVEKGIVEPGFGYWPIPNKDVDFLIHYAAFGGKIYLPEQNKLIIQRGALLNAYSFKSQLITEEITHKNLAGSEQNHWMGRLLLRDTAFHDRLLFWGGENHDWIIWALDYADGLGGQDYLFEHFGFALFPSAVPGKPGNNFSFAHYYVIPSEKASGQQNQEAACAVLAKTITPEINALNAVESASLGVLKTQFSHPAFTQDRFVSETMYFLDYAWYKPSQDNYTSYTQLLLEYLIKVELGEMSASEATEAAINQLQIELGESLIVE